jgi:hypothetical protein
MKTATERLANIKAAFAEYEIFGRTLFWAKTGALIRYDDGMLYVENLNPQVRTRWRMSRMDMFRLGLRCIRAALTNG